MNLNNTYISPKIDWYTEIGRINWRVIDEINWPRWLIDKFSFFILKILRKKRRTKKIKSMLTIK